MWGNSWYVIKIFKNIKRTAYKPRKPSYLSHFELSPIFSNMRFLDIFHRSGPSAGSPYGMQYGEPALFAWIPWKKSILIRRFISIICSIMIYVQTANKRCFSLNQMEDWAKFVLIYLVFRYIGICLKITIYLYLLVPLSFWFLVWNCNKIKRNKFNLFPTLVHFLKKTFFYVFVHIHYSIMCVQSCFVGSRNLTTL